MATISFTTTFNLSTTPKQFQFVDTSDYAGQGIATTDVNGCFKIVAPSGITIYNNTDFDNADCDIFIDDSTSNQTTIQLPLATNGLPEVGNYIFTYTVYNSDTDEYYTEINTYTYDYVRPTVEITQTVDCLSPLFTSTDGTNYVVNGITPTIDGTHTVYLPAAADVSPETESFTAAGSVISLGFAEFYNGTQTTVITADLTYTFSDDLIVVDEITGSKEILVDCQDTCGIYCCLRSVEQQMIGYKDSNQVKYVETSALFSQIMAIAGIAQMAIRCGKSTDVSGYLTQIKLLANCTDDCSCSGSEPTPVTGLGGLINDVVVVSGDAVVDVEPVTVGNTTTYTITLDETFVNKVNNLYNTVVAQGTNITVTDSGIISGVRTFTVNSTADSIWEEGSGTEAIQTKDNGADASGNYAIAGGYNASATGTASVAIGAAATATATDSTAVGADTHATGVASTAVGSVTYASGLGATSVGNSASATGINSVAIGTSSICAIDNTNNIKGFSITRKSSAGSNAQDWTASKLTFTTPQLDLKTVFDYQMLFPTGSTFFLDEVDLILTTLGGTVTTQPTIKVGIPSVRDLYYAAAITTNLTATLFNREKLTLIQSAATAKGQPSLSASTTIAAIGSSTIKGRFVFKGYLIENE